MVSIALSRRTSLFLMLHIHYSFTIVYTYVKSEYLYSSIHATCMYMCTSSKYRSRQCGTANYCYLNSDGVSSGRCIHYDVLVPTTFYTMCYTCKPINGAAIGLQ